jgi:hypothetical protein
MRQLVLGTACGYKSADISPFLISLRKTGYTGDIVIFTYQLDAESQRLFQQTQTLALPIHPATLSGRYRFLYQIFPKMLGMKRFRTHHWRDGELWMHIQNGRYVAYAQALENWTESYDEILLCDVPIPYFNAIPLEPNTNYVLGF